MQTIFTMLLPLFFTLQAFGQQKELVITTDTFLSPPIFDGQSIYWSVYDGGAPKIFRADLDGTNRQILVHGGACHTQVVGGNLFYSSANNLISVPVSGGQPFVVRHDDEGVCDFIVAGENLIWLSPRGGLKMAQGNGPAALLAPTHTATSLKSIGANLYWLDGSLADGIWTLPLGSHGYATQFAGDLVHEMATDGNQIYWADQTEHTLMQKDVNGGQAAVVFNGPSCPLSVAVDSDTLYWSDCFKKNGLINQIPLSGGVPRTVVSGLTHPQNIQIVQDFIYWQEGSTLWRVQKPTK